MQETTRAYLRPVPCAPDLPMAERLRPGLWVREVEIRTRGMARQVLPLIAAREMYADAPLFHPVVSCFPGMREDRASVMGIVNVTPDSFSDGGRFIGHAEAIAHGRRLVEEGADLLDIGGESTRPGAAEVSVAEELDRVMPVVEAMVADGVPVSIDTRKSDVAQAAVAAGAELVNDVSALSFDPAMAGIAARAPAVCLMHAQGDPATMQDAPRYDDVVLDVYDYLEERLQSAQLHGVERGRMMIDPGIGFGKTVDHNLALLRAIGLFAGLAPVLLGVSRKRFIGTLSGESVASQRLGGSIAAVLPALSQGVSVIRVHDVAETVQAVRVWTAVAGNGA